MCRHIFSSIDKDNIIHEYNSGIGVNGIAKRLGLNCSFRPIERYLKSVYGTLRNRSEQQQARMDRSTPEQKAALVKKAHDAVRGSKRTISSLRKRAKTIEGSINHRSNGEALVLKALQQAGLNPIPSKAINTYNADFAINSVTVEVFGGGWSYSDHARISNYIKRTKYIGKRGYHVIFFIIPRPDDIGDCTKLIASIDQFSRLPSGASQYRVIWGDRDGSSGLCKNVDKSAFIRPFVNVRNPTTGRYESVPR